MKTRSEKMKVSVLSFAVQGALAAMFAAPMMAEAAGDDVAALTQPTNTIEVGAANVSQKSAKFGEYNGLNDRGGVFIGNFSVRGGDAYGAGNGTSRWSISGTDLGTTSRALGASVSDQGKWNLGIGYDELRHNISDTYQTPQQGSMGGNTFTLPAGFGTFNGGANPATRGLTAAQLGAFHTEEVSTTRKNTSFVAGFNFNSRLGLQFDFNRLKQSGAKLIGTGALGGIVPTTGTWRAEAVNILMNPTNYTTDNFNVALNWVGDKGHVTGSYFGSSFSDGYDRLSGQNSSLNNAASTCVAPCTFQTNTMSTAPDNKAHQWALNGGYAFSPATKLAGGISYGRNTQNAGFLTGFTEIVAAPQSSLSGLVVTKHADLKLTHQATRDLSLRAAYKHNERDNRTASNTYRYYAINNVTTVDVATNAPYSNKKTEIELGGDYRVRKGHILQLAYNHDKTSRWCNSTANSFNCLVSPSSKEDKLGIKYKLKAMDNLGFNVGYTYAKRKSDFDHNAVTPLAGLDAAAPNDVNSQDYPGFIGHIYASRKQEMVKAGVNWQATDKLDLGLNGRYSDDKYHESTLGVQNGRTTGLNFDAAYNYKENSSVAAYWSWQNSKRNLRSGAAGGVPAADNTAATYAALVAPKNIFTNQLKDDSTAVGINSKHSGLMNGKLEVNGDLSYSLDKTGYETQLEYVLASCAPGNRTSCGALPDIKSRVITFKLTGAYQLDKSAKIAFAYIYQQRKTEDYYYNTLLYGYTPNRVMPTNEEAPNYSENVVGVSYVYSFR